MCSCHNAGKGDGSSAKYPVESHRGNKEPARLDWDFWHQVQYYFPPNVCPDSHKPVPTGQPKENIWSASLKKQALMTETMNLQLFGQMWSILITSFTLFPTLLLTAELWGNWGQEEKSWISPLMKKCFLGIETFRFSLPAAAAHTADSREGYWRKRHPFKTSWDIFRGNLSKSFLPKF